MLNSALESTIQANFLLMLLIEQRTVFIRDKSWYNQYSYVESLWWINSEALRTNIQIMHQEWKISHQMEKIKCSLGLLKNGKQLKENYHLISLLPICGRILERLIKTRRFTEKKLFLPINDTSDHGTPASINCYVVLPIFINIFMTVWRIELSFWTISKANF